MDILKQYIDQLTKEEIRNYKIFALRTNRHTDRKDIQLFDYYRKSNDQFMEEMHTNLYSTNDKNALYRLRNRLQEDIANSLLLLNMDRDGVSNILKHLSLFELFLAKKQYVLANYHIRKAELNAFKTENLELLDLTYANIIKLSNEYLEINPEEYIKKRAANAIELNKTRKIDQLLATLNFRLKTAQNFTQGDKGLLKIVTKTFKEYKTDISLINNKIYQTKIYQAISQVMVQQHHYKELAEYVKETYERFMDTHWFDKKNHDLKIQMIIYMINANFFNLKYELSLIYTKLLGAVLQEFDNLYYERYLFFYYNSLVVNFAHTNFEEALKKIDEFEKLMRQRKSNFYDQFIYLNRATLLFEINKYNDGIRNITKLYVSPAYENIDTTFKLKIEVAELIMQFESGDRKVLFKRIEQVRKKHETRLRENSTRERIVLDLIEELAKEERLRSTHKVYHKIVNFINRRVEQELESSEVINYKRWFSEMIDKVTK